MTIPLCPCDRDARWTLGFSGTTLVRSAVSKHPTSLESTPQRRSTEPMALFAWSLSTPLCVDDEPRDPFHRNGLWPERPRLPYSSFPLWRHESRSPDPGLTTPGFFHSWAFSSLQRVVLRHRSCLVSYRHHLWGSKSEATVLSRSVIPLDLFRKRDPTEMAKPNMHSDKSSCASTELRPTSYPPSLGSRFRWLCTCATPLTFCP